MKRELLTKILALVVLMVAGSIPVVADHDIDLQINGDFRGRPSGYSPAPGWTLTADGGGARVLPTKDHDEFCLELQASHGRPQSVVSEAHFLRGGVLELELKASGSGTAAVGYEALDDSQERILFSDRQVFQLNDYDQKVKRHFTLKGPAKYIRIRLTAEAGSTVRFRDVEAELSGPVPTPAPGVIPAPPAPGRTHKPAPPAPGVIPAPAPASQMREPGHQPAPPKMDPPPAHGKGAPMPPPIPAPKKLRDDKFFSFSSLGANEHYEASIPVGSDIDFDLEEESGHKHSWKVVSYDSNVCRVKLEHDRDGVFPFRRYKAEIELKALRPGRTEVIFSCGRKKFTVHFTAL